MLRDELTLILPAWLREALGRDDIRCDSVEAKMQFVIDQAGRNIEAKTGGPFAAAVFEIESGKLVAAGVNVVETQNCSIAHAEMMALALAQRSLGHYDLGFDSVGRELVTSTEPCAMCLGAIPWSGVRRIVCSACGEDACAIGFDEGAKPTDWVAALNERGIEVVREVLRPQGRAILQNYLASGGAIYNSRES